MKIVEGIVVSIIYHNTENGYTVAIMDTENEEFTVVGNLPGCHENIEYRLEGEFKIHNKFGEQFAFTSYEELLPSTCIGIENFLSSGIIKGIGPKFAKLIVDKFGEDTLTMLDENPEKLLDIDGIGPKKYEMIKESYQDHRDFAKVSVFFQEYGINSNQVMKIYKVYGQQTIEAVTENPYIIIEEVDGFGFKRTDEIAFKMGFQNSNEFRIKSGVEYVLKCAGDDGNMFLPKEMLIDRSVQLLDVSSEEIEDALIDLSYQGKIKIDTVEESEVVYNYDSYKIEQNICRDLMRLKEAEFKTIVADADALIRRTESEIGLELSERQKNAVKSSIFEGVSVITGGPGTGKTTIINAIIDIIKSVDFKVAIAAPTGRAAKRITETSGHEATTIHRLLGYSFSDVGKEMYFKMNSDNPLNYDAIIIDEASMIDSFLMSALLNAVKSGTRLLLVGDVDQLPSVGAGNVLRDIIDSEYIHTIRLTEVFRQAQESMIVVNAHRINQGEYPYCNEKDKDFFMIRKDKEVFALNVIKELVDKRLKNYYDWCVPIRDIQILTPIKKGMLGSKNINTVLQEVLNPKSDSKKERKFGERVFREGDKIMQLKNNYEMTWKKTSDFSEGEGIFNGDIGFIKDIDLGEGTLTAIFDDEKYVTYEFSQLDEIELAYAMTVHKSQGSEFPIVIMPMTWFPPMLSTRNLLYTGVTRGKKIIVLVGSENRMKGMVDNNAVIERYSGLKYRIKKFGFEIN